MLTYPDSHVHDSIEHRCSEYTTIAFNQELDCLRTHNKSELLTRACTHVPFYAFNTVSGQLDYIGNCGT